jgi:hypothetical protein
MVVSWSCGTPWFGRPTSLKHPTASLYDSLARVARPNGGLWFSTACSEIKTRRISYRSSRASDRAWWGLGSFAVTLIWSTRCQTKAMGFSTVISWACSSVFYKILSLRSCTKPGACTPRVTSSCTPRWNVLIGRSHTSIGGELYPHHRLRATSSTCSNHAPPWVALKHPRTKQEQVQAKRPRGARGPGHEFIWSCSMDEMALAAAHQCRPLHCIAATYCGQGHGGTLRGIYVLVDRGWLCGLVLVGCPARWPTHNRYSSWACSSCISSCT